MATWQFDCVLVPRRGEPLTPSSVAEAVREGTARLWAGVAAEVVRAALLNLGQPAATWDPTTERRGDEDGTCLLLTAADGVVEEVRLRIDLRADAAGFLATLCAACQALDLMVSTERGEVVEASTAALTRAAEGSPADRFPRHGAAVLAELAAELRAARPDELGGGPRDLEGEGERVEVGDDGVGDGRVEPD